MRPATVEFLRQRFGSYYASAQLARAGRAAAARMGLSLLLEP